MTIDPRTSALVMKGKPGHIQFYSMHTDKQLYNVSRHNILTREKCFACLER